jgi:SAM-dependent methyltransferase
MPSVEENRAIWGKDYSWPHKGDEWSAVWGGVETHWYATILPRIRRFLPARRILEIAPGYGRWSIFLIDCAEEYIGVDLNPECVSACQARFPAASHARFVANDGKSLAAVDEGSIDFAFSFDSLVHAEIDIIDAYLHELSRTLSPDGVAIIHHSNLGEYGKTTRNLSRLLSMPARRLPLAEKMLRKSRLIDWEHWRAQSVSARKVADLCSVAGLVCIGQEIIDWGHESRRMVDCLSTLTRLGSKWERPNVVVRNPHFMAEAFSAHAISEVYASLLPCEQQRVDEPTH